MARAFQINGPCLVLVKGRSDSAIGSLQELGLSDKDITVTPVVRHEDANVDAVGQGPADTQFMYAEARVQMTLVHFDRTFLNTCIQLSMGAGAAIGQTGRAGTLMGNGLARFAAGNNYIGLNLTSPVGTLPYCFQFAYLPDNAVTWPLGVKKSIVSLNWRVIPFQIDPYNSGNSNLNNPLWTNTLDT